MREAGETYLERLNREHRERQTRLRTIRPPENIRPRVITPQPPPVVPAPEPDASIVSAHFSRPLVPYHSVAVDISPDIMRRSIPQALRTAAIISTVARHFGVRKEDILSQRRTQNIVLPRHTAIYLTRMLTPRSLPDIGRSFGQRDHSSALHAVRKITRLMSANPEFAATVERLRARILGVE